MYFQGSAPKFVLSSLAGIDHTYGLYIGAYHHILMCWAYLYWEVQLACDKLDGKSKWPNVQQVWHLGHSELGILSPK